MIEEHTAVPALRQRWLRGERLVGTFVKTTSHQIVEVLARSGLDFIVLDAEHAPFDRGSLDSALLAARALGLPALVRIPDITPGTVLAMLDMGAEGVLIPHITDAAVAAKVARSARYQDGMRGFSNSHRAADYGRPDLAQYLREADARALVIAQIEDRAALGDLDVLMSAPGIDGFLIGRADLMVSLGAVSLDAPEVVHAVGCIAAAARAAKRPLGLFLPAADPAELARYSVLGTSLFVIGSDQSLMKQSARQIVRIFRAEETSHEQ